MPQDRLLHPKAGHSDKVTRLSHFEYRVWTQYLLSADDFGVMRAAAVSLQADNDALAQTKASLVQAAIEKLIACGLVHFFEHQGRRYLFQADWQYWQKVEFPRATNEPKPPADSLDKCDELTRGLFEKHPGGQRRIRGGSGGQGSAVVQGSSVVHIPNDSGHVQDARAVRIPTTRARGRAERLTLTANANGERLTANVPLDLWLRDLQAAYPAQSVTTGYLTQSAFCDVIQNDPRPPADVFAELLDHLENQKRGYQWRVKRMIPSLESWLRLGKWKQLHDEAPPTTLVSERTISTHIAGEAFVKGGGHDTH